MTAQATGSVDTTMIQAAPLDHLSVMLAWLQRLLAWQIDVTRQIYGPLADDPYRGLYIPDGEVDLLHALAPQLPAELAQRRSALFSEYAAIEQQALAAQRAGANLPLLRIGQVFGLSPIEQATLLLALAPDVDLRFERLYAYIQDDVTRKRPSVELALRLFCADSREQLLCRPIFGPAGGLLRYRLIQLADDAQRGGPLLGSAIRLDEWTAAALLGQPMIDPQIARAATLERPMGTLDDLLLPPELRQRLRRAVAERRAGLAIGLRGLYGSGRRAIARAICAEYGAPLLDVDLPRLIDQEADGAGPAELCGRVVREAMLHGAAVLWRGADRALGADAPPAWREALRATLDDSGLLSLLALERLWEARGGLRRAGYMLAELPAPSYSEREQLWARRLGAESPGQSLIEAAASTFRLSPGQIRDAAAMARDLARWNGVPLSAAEIYAACRAQSSGKLDSLANKIATTYRWDDIVLPADQVAQLREISLQVRHRRTVLERWGFDRKLAMGKGVNVLFAGQSGTGKTMAAEIIAADLGLDVFKVDLATMVSKYIGETEKNLDKVFQAAREANAILFFDEADAIFGKRSEVKDAHDRYANIEVGYLLQKMEEYDGVVILATNLKKNLDDAFVRRLHTTIDFPFPEEEDRLRIWRKAFPEQAPVAEDVDLAFLSRQFKLAGGNIRNIALMAAYLAADDGGSITMVHIVRAIRREYQKLGKLLTEADFGRYLPLVRAAGLTPA
jgi:AAA+ superfamily predicted ATPase